MARSSFNKLTTFKLFIEYILRGLGEVYMYERMPLLLIRLSENHSLTTFDNEPCILLHYTELTRLCEKGYWNIFYMFSLQIYKKRRSS
jgi:hypothetical protein